jgi:hypothetical protein
VDVDGTFVVSINCQSIAEDIGSVSADIAAMFDGVPQPTVAEGFYSRNYTIPVAPTTNIGTSFSMGSSQPISAASGIHSFGVRITGNPAGASSRVVGNISVSFQAN